MNAQKVLVGFAVIVILAIGGLFVLNQNETNDTTTNQSEQVSTNQQSTENNNSTTTANESISGGNYLEYTEENLASSSDTNRVLFFHAEWCPICKFYERDIIAVGVPSDITVIEADFDSEQALKDKYNVDIQSTFVLIDENGDVLRTWRYAAGIDGAEDLFNQIREELS